MSTMKIGMDKTAARHRHGEWSEGNGLVARLGRFLALTGIGPSELRQQVSSPQMLAGILDHVMQDETLLMVFAAETGLKPESVAAAHRALSGPEPERTP